MPLTLGLSVLVAIMETVYVMTGRPIWRQFWACRTGPCGHRGRIVQAL
ncbi:hypothetical protein [Thalassococcus sp.]